MRLENDVRIDPMYNKLWRWFVYRDTGRRVNILFPRLRGREDLTKLYSTRYGCNVLEGRLERRASHDEGV